MTKEEIIDLGRLMGLSFNEKTNFKDSLEKGWVVFDGCNGQRFLFESAWTDEKIYKELGESLILMGRRQIKLEFSQFTNPMTD